MTADIGQGFSTTIEGMFIVFVTLAILFVIIAAFKFINKSPSNQPNVPSEPEATRVIEKITKEETGLDDKELIAVISAAIAMAIGTSVDNLKVTRITRHSDSSTPWNKAGLNEQMSRRI